ncbi:cytidine deaminase [Oricola cellulosilytica]|uniref:Cytidine deaminase n=1 Tax=Oricola cellulosilytica TaxID=1429082 RepID=A0A4R0PH07_9HYPH|nr:cytidine deaminase [Oricola cellulosilytica]TCD16094.1 cytidine deaminase [Oricola cellulosilytica]
MADLDALYAAARAAMAKSHSPYSEFPVGAAILTADGTIYSGANIEVISYPEGWCAETTALAHFVMGGGGVITDICVTAERKALCTPCGGCRQRLAEFAPPEARIHLTDANGIAETVTVRELFPRGFEAEALST